LRSLTALVTASIALTLGCEPAVNESAASEPAAVEEPAARQAPVLAETRLGPLTTEDLEDQIRWGAGLPDGDLVRSVDWEALDGLLRQAALEQILLHLAEERGLTRDPSYQSYLDLRVESALIREAELQLIYLPSEPTREEMDAYRALHADRGRLPALATWRFMHFAVSEFSSAESRAREAANAVASGEDFETVALEMASRPQSGEPGGIVGPLEFENSVAPPLAEALRTLPLNTPSAPIALSDRWVVMSVISRELERQLPPLRTAWAAGEELKMARREAYRERTLRELRERFPVVIPEPLTLDMPDASTALSVGDRTWTLADLRQRAQVTSFPEASLARLLTPEARERLADELLLLAEWDRLGRVESAETQDKMRRRRRFLTLEHMVNTVQEERASDDLMQELLVEYGYRRFEDLTRLRWGDDGKLILIDR